MPSYRQDRINDAVAGEISEILRNVKDPRVSKCFVSISGAEVSRDLSVAKVYYSVLGSDDDLSKGIASASGYIRGELAKRLNLRITPKIIFIRDKNTETAMEISKILNEINDADSKKDN